MKNTKVSLHVLIPLIIMMLPLSAGAQTLAGQGDSSQAPLSDGQLWQNGVQAYADGNFSTALSLWLQLLDCGSESAQLYYNIGNAYYKTGETPLAILFYERALKLDPSYEDARFNLDFVNTLVKDKIDVVPEFIAKTWLRNICYSLSSNVWAVVSLVMFALTLVLLLLFLLSYRSAVRKTGFYLAIAAFLLFAGSFGAAMAQKSEHFRSDYAIVTAPVSAAKSSPAKESAKDLFVLHEGTKVRIVEAVGLWLDVELSDGRRGWIEKADLTVI